MPGRLAQIDGRAVRQHPRPWSTCKEVNVAKRSVEDRFWSKVDTGGECWLWLASLYHGGYGGFWDGKRTVRAHRWAYESEFGPIPDGLTLDHLCRTRACVRPDHLEAVTDRTNILRGTGPTARNAAATHCIHGHLFDEANTFYHRKGGRRCRECHRVETRGAQRRKRAALKGATNGGPSPTEEA